MAWRQARAFGAPGDPGPPPDAFEIGVRLLALRAHSAVELRRKLLQRGCGRVEIDAALIRLQEIGYQSDAEFAGELVRARASRQGRLAVAADLARRGVSREISAEALAGVSPDDELASARGVASKMPAVDARRLGGRLQRRGFGSDVIRQVVRERAGGEDLDA